MIQSAAKKLFFQKGYINCTMDGIADLAGVGKGSIYLYFKNKDDLYLSLMIPVLKEINRSGVQFRKDIIDGKYRTGKEVLMMFCKRYQDLYNFDPEGIRIIQAFQQGNLVSAMTQETRAEYNKITRENFRNARDIVRKCVALKLFPPTDPVRLIDLLWGTFIGIVQLEESKYRATRRDHIMDMLEFAFEKISEGICS
jgi:AcrR family transcriptional regulator